MSKIEKGDTVKVHYTGKLEDGTVFDTSREREPLEFTLGEGQLIPGFEKAVEGLTEGETTTVKIPTEEAYGEWNDELELEVSRDDLPDHIEPEVGMQLQMQQQQSEQMVPVKITNVTDEAVKLDANHPLAGKTLIFDIEVV